MRAADDASCDSDLNEAKTQNPVSRLQLRLKAQVRHSHSQPASKFGRGSVPSRGALESQIPNVAFQEIRVCRRSAWNVMRVQPQRSRGSCIRARDTQMDKIRALARRDPKRGEDRRFPGGESSFAFRGLRAPEICNYAGIQGIQISYEKLNCP